MGKTPARCGGRGQIQGKLNRILLKKKKKNGGKYNNQANLKTQNTWKKNNKNHTNKKKVSYLL